VKLIVFWGIMGLCGLAILTAFLGYLNAWVKTCCTISFYSFMSLILFIAFLLIGGLLMTVTIASNMQID
jgi:tellurite resistance protein TehA-like permease